MLNLKQVAEELNFKERTVRQWVLDGRIKAVKVAGEWRVRREIVEKIKEEGL